MVSIVTGSGSGLVNSSKDVLGGAGELGNAATGRAGERVTVNAATGNLVIQDRDEYLVGLSVSIDGRQPIVHDPIDPIGRIEQVEEVLEVRLRVDVAATELELDHVDRPPPQHP